MPRRTLAEATVRPWDRAGCGPPWSWLVLAAALLATLWGLAGSAQEHGGHGTPGGGDRGLAATATTSEVAGYTNLTLAPVVAQTIGVTTGSVQRADLNMTIRTVAIVQPDETKVVRIHLKTEGWVEKLFVDYTGQAVKKGDPLLSIYSPQFVVAQQEYLTARQATRGAAGDAAVGDVLLQAARQKLQLWDVPLEEIQRLEKSGQPLRALTLRSPVTGTVLEKNTFVGQYVMPQEELYVVADLSTVWVQGKIYEQELMHVELGHDATVSVPGLPGKSFTGKVVFIAPTVDEVMRTAQVRLQMPNRAGLFKPGMFAHIELQHRMGQGLLIPESAVLRGGMRNVVFKVLPEHRYQPVEVQISPISFQGRFQVLAGLQEGEQVVTSANFLIDSESRLQLGMGTMAGMPGMEMPAPPPAPPPPAKPQADPGALPGQAEPAPAATPSGHQHGR